jgi:hypothetical protein
MKQFIALWIAGLMLAVTAGNAVAAAIVPTYSTFGTLSGATFGGSGIPNDAVAITTIVDGNNTITLGLTATARFAEPPVGNNGAGTFSALAGGFTGNPALARWNFNYYIDIQGGGKFSDYAISLLYDLDPAVGTDVSDHGSINFSTAAPTATLAQDSQNLGFSFLAGPAIPGVLTPPTFGPFASNASGEYTFALRVSSLNAVDLGESAIRVNVAEVPEPASLAMWSLGGIGMMIARRKRQKKLAA